MENYIKNDKYDSYNNVYVRYSTNKYLFMLNALFKANVSELSGVIFLKKISSNWTSGQIRTSYPSMNDELIGPYIEYGNAPKDYVKYRVIKNDDGSIYFDRYVDATDAQYSINNISYMILYKNPEAHNYLVYGIDLEDNLSNVVNNG